MTLMMANRRKKPKRRSNGLMTNDEKIWQFDAWAKVLLTLFRNALDPWVLPVVRVSPTLGRDDQSQGSSSSIPFCHTGQTDGLGGPQGRWVWRGLVSC